MTPRRWLAVALTVTGAALIVTGTVLRAVHARGAVATGTLLAVATVVCVVAALAVARGTRRRS